MVAWYLRGDNTSYLSDRTDKELVIEKWEVIKEKVVEKIKEGHQDFSILDGGADTCLYCRKYYQDGEECLYCPICKKVNVGWCLYTPYDFTLEDTLKDKLDAIIEELAFLKSLPDE